VGLGVDELSADAGSLDEVRAALAACTMDELRSLARAALVAPDAAAVRGAAAVLIARGAGSVEASEGGSPAA
jgi:phosphoenolpyruvate-protein kinase (PTS system EI component)